MTRQAIGAISIGSTFQVVTTWNFFFCHCFKCFKLEANLLEPRHELRGATWLPGILLIGIFGVGWFFRLSAAFTGRRGFLVGWLICRQFARLVESEIEIVQQIGDGLLLDTLIGAILRFLHRFQLAHWRLVVLRLAPLVHLLGAHARAETSCRCSRLCSTKSMFNGYIYVHVLCSSQVLQTCNIVGNLSTQQMKWNFSPVSVQLLDYRRQELPHWTWK